MNQEDKEAAMKLPAIRKQLRTLAELEASTLAKFDELVPVQFDVWERADSITRFMRITK